MPRPVSLAFDLFTFWVSVPAGVGVSMQEMLDQLGATDTQSIRNALVRLRMGRVPDPSRAGSFLRRLPVRYHPVDGKYYDFSKVSPSAIDAQVPATVLVGRFAELMTRVTTLDSAMGNDGLVRSADQLLDDAQTKQLIGQLPVKQIFAVANLALQVAQARQLIEMEELKRLGPGGSTGTPDAGPDLEDNDA